MLMPKGRKLEAMKVVQNGTPLYMTTITAKDLPGLTKVDAWTPTNNAGYQRIPIQSRFKNIAKYLMGKEGAKPILPQAVVLNYRQDAGELKFTPANGNFGTLEVPEGAILYEVDGQHRLGGLRYAAEQDAKYADYSLPMVITDGLPRLDEAVLFFVVNTEQKRVPTDLAQRIIEQEMGDENLRIQIVAHGKDWIPKGTKVVDNMVMTAGNPWYGKIGIPGTKLAGVLMKQVSFVTSLKGLLSGTFYGTLDSDDISQLLIRYWQALETVYPEAFADPDEYVIQKTVGVFPLHAIASDIFERVRNASGKITKDGILEVLKQMNKNLEGPYGSGSQFWHGKDGEAGKYAGAKGFRILTDILRQALPAMKMAKVV
jgi:DGQHR domain-containing protein